MPIAPDLPATRDDTPTAPPPALPFFWWCAVCQRRTGFGYDQLGQFVRQGWPVCCGAVVLACKCPAGTAAEEAVGR